VDGHGLDRSNERFAAGLRLIRPLEFREHVEHFEALPLLMRGDLTFGDLLPEDLEIPEDDLLRPLERVPLAASGAATNATSKAAVMIHRAAFFIG
jgi:hypothetical protein